MTTAEVSLSPPSAMRHPRVALAFLAALVTTGLVLLLRTDRQIAVSVLLAGLAGLAVGLDRTALGRRVQAAAHVEGGFGSVLALIVVMVVIVASRDDHYASLMIATVALFATACVGLNLQVAFAGVANFAAAAFFTLGAYTAGILAQHTMLPHLIVLLAGGLLAGAAGLLLLLPVLRTRGHYAAIVTISFGLMLRSFLEANDAFGGPQGLKIPGFTMFGVAFNDVQAIAGVDVSFYVPYALLGVALFALSLFLLKRLETSWIGVCLDMVRTDEIVSATFGLGLARWKATAFVLGNIIIGTAGAAYGMMNGFVNPNGAAFGESLLLLSIVVLGGLGNAFGAVAAAIIVLVVPEKLNAIQEYKLLLFSVLVLGCLVFRPKGLLPRPMRDLSRFVTRTRLDHV